MKKLLPNLIIAICLGLTLTVSTQNIEILDIERLHDQSIVIPAQCSPEDMIVLIKSSIQDLRFESNMLPDTAFKILYLPESNEYIICHEKIRFKLTVSGPDLQSEDIDIFSLDENHVYRLTSNIYRGTVNFNTTPPNTTILFTTLGNQAVGSEEPFVSNSGTYPVTITKQKYRSIDTVITIPRDGTRDYSFTLKPLFAQLKLNISTEDNADFTRAPILWIDERRISMDAYMRPVLARRFYDDVVDFQLYENNIIPLPEGNYRLRVEADNYLPFETAVFAEEGKITEVPIMMELIYGFITVIDSGNAAGARVFVNNQYIGDEPVHKARARVGMNTLRFEKPGYMTERSEYYVNIFENAETDFWVKMRVSRRITVLSDPPAAEVILNNNRIGFTPHTASIPAGNHKLLLRRVGHSPVLHELVEDHAAKPEDTLRFILYENQPLSLKSEGRHLSLYFGGLGELKNIQIPNPNSVPADIQLPHGKYRIKTTDFRERTTYKGLLHHRPDKANRKIPSYSRTSFTVITADYIDDKSIEGSFGRIHLFNGSGLSSSLVSAHYYNFERLAHNQEILNKENNEAVNLNKTEAIIPYLFFFNWDWRLGGSIVRQFDVCLLGRARWTPGLQVAQLNLFDFHDARMLTYFYGVEVSTRISGLNFNLKIGQQVMDGQINIWDQEYLELEKPLKIFEENLIVSFGLTLNGRVGQSNNMLRLWRKPLVYQIIDRFF